MVLFEFLAAATCERGELTGQRFDLGASLDLIKPWRRQPTQRSHEVGAAMLGGPMLRNELGRGSAKPLNHWAEDNGSSQLEFDAACAACAPPDERPPFGGEETCL